MNENLKWLAATLLLLYVITLLPTFLKVILIALYIWQFIVMRGDNNET